MVEAPLSRITVVCLGGMSRAAQHRLDWAVGASADARTPQRRQEPGKEEDSEEARQAQDARPPEASAGRDEDAGHGTVTC